MIGISTGLFYKYLYEKKLGFKKIGSSKEYFQKFSYEKMSIRYDNLNSKVTDILFWVFLSISVFSGFLLLSYNNPIQSIEIIQIFFLGNAAVPIIIIYSQLLVKTSITSKNDFNFFLTSGYFSIIDKYHYLNDTKKTHYVMKALNSYNNYLVNEFKLKLSKQDAILAKIIGMSSDTMDANITKLKIALDRKELDFLRCLESLLDDENLVILEQKRITLPINQPLTITGIVISVIYQIATSTPTILELIKKAFS